MVKINGLTEVVCTVPVLESTYCMYYEVPRYHNTRWLCAVVGNLVNTLQYSLVDYTFYLLSRPEPVPKFIVFS
jgi:hypothetical protein